MAQKVSNINVKNQNLKINYVTELEHDKQLNIATATNHKALKWKNEKTTWGEFLHKLSEPVIGKDTVAEYNAMSKAQKGAAKDVGGFVGGELLDGRRKNGNVISRHIISLDLDYADDTFLDMLELTADYAYAVYTTRSHRPESPRFRLIIPVSRPVSAEEYEPVARKLAETYDLDLFDDTTYEPTRLMYWGSVSSNGEYIFDYQDAPFVNPDEVLSQYVVDWRDPLEWPVSSREGQKMESLAKQQGDPYEKPGLIGAFNRAYSITNVIDEFLSDVYEPHGDGRYTFIGGSTSGGLVIYDDKFAYSHHGTDPISNQLVSAFDLLRIHKYGDQDERSRVDTKVTSLPSHQSMTRFVQNDKKVSASIAQERLKEAEDEFDIIETDEEIERDDSWMQKLEVNLHGEFDSSIPNISLILDNDPSLKGKLAYNEFAYRMTRKGRTPWNKSEDEDYWDDSDEAGLRYYLEKVYKIHNVSKTNDAIQNTMHKNAFHPVKEYLDSLEWDGTERLETVFIDFLGAEDTELNRAITRKMMTAAVARVYRPGCKFDYMLTLYGSQGIGKSRILYKLGKGWFSDSITSINGKEGYEALQGSWIVEMAELSATRKSDIESTKHFISKQEDKFRPAYGRHQVNYPRQCVFVGTTNDVTFLKDRTGNRRFWPMVVDKDKTRKSFDDLTDDYIDQLWAEAVRSYENKEPLVLSKKLEAEMEEVQESHTEISPMTGVIQEYLEIKLPKDWDEYTISQRQMYISGSLTSLNGDEDKVINSSKLDDDLITRERVSAVEVWCECFGNDLKKFPMIDRREINEILRNLPGWKSYDGNKKGSLKFGKAYGEQRAYVKLIEENFIDYDLI